MHKTVTHPAVKAVYYLVRRTKVTGNKQQDSTSKLSRKICTCNKVPKSSLLKQQEGIKGVQSKVEPPSFRNTRDRVKAKKAGASYSVIVGGIWVLITSDNLRSHPVGGAYEGVSPPNRPVELSTHTKIDCGRKRKEGVEHN